MEYVHTFLYDTKGSQKFDFKVDPKINASELVALVSKQLKVKDDLIIIFVKDENSINWINETSVLQLKDGMEILPKLKSESEELQKLAKKLEHHKHFFLSDAEQRAKLIHGVKSSVKGFLRFELVSGRDLAPMDPNGKSDPFTILQLSPDITFKSHTKLKTLEPEWNELFYIPIYDQTRLLVAVFDWDLASTNDFIGWAEVDVLPLLDFKPRDMWLQLVKTKKGKTQSRGFVHIRMQVKNKFEADKKIFGTSLIDIRQFQKNQGGDIPFIVDATITELEKRGVTAEGIGRISGSSVNEIRQSIDKGDEVDLSKADIHSVCGILKLYLRELPEPLFPKFLYEDIISCATNHPKEASVLKPLLFKLPLQNRKILNRLLQLLSKIAANAEENKMNSRNLSIVFAPNILYPKEIDATSLLVEGNLLCETLMTLIDNYSSLGLDNL